jgi:4a-hydroxytetrahydrobiopterin dehydratase
MALLTREQIQENLQSLPGWAVRDGRLAKAFTVRSFTHGVVFLGAIAQLAEAANHHPDVQLHDYNRVTVAIVTHSEGGLTGKDFDLARQIETLPHKKPKEAN